MGYKDDLVMADCQSYAYSELPPDEVSISWAIGGNCTVNGLERAKGLGGTECELGDMEVVGRNFELWDIVKKNKDKKKCKNKSNESDHNSRGGIIQKNREEYINFTISCN